MATTVTHHQNMSEISKYENGSTVFAGDNVIDKNKIDKYPIVSNLGSLITQILDGEIVTPDLNSKLSDNKTIKISTEEKHDETPESYFTEDEILKSYTSISCYMKAKLVQAECNGARSNC